MKTTYNKSEIFTSAWKLVKSAGKSLSEALKAAWKKVKGMEVKVYAIDQIKEMIFSVAGQSLSLTKTIGITGKFFFVSGKKVALSNDDIQEIEKANQIMFLYSASQNGKAYRDGSIFYTGKFASGMYIPSNIEAFINILAKNNIQLS